MTSFYTFRMLFVFFHGASTPLSHHSTPLSPRATNDHSQSIGKKERSVSGVEPVMTFTLVPLALLGLFGGLLNLPEYMGSHGLLTGFLGAIPGFSGAGHRASR